MNKRVMLESGRLFRAMIHWPDEEDEIVWDNDSSNFSTKKIEYTLEEEMFLNRILEYNLQCHTCKYPRFSEVMNFWRLSSVERDTEKENANPNRDLVANCI